MKHLVIKSLVSVLIATSLMCGAGVYAGTYPEKPITLILPYEQGCTADLMVRPLCDLASRRLGQPVVVVNKPGGGGSIGARDVYNAKPDGYTIGSYMGMLLYKLQGITPFGHRDFKMVGMYNIEPIAIAVHAKRPWKNIQEVIAHAKANPGKVSAAVSSKGAYFWSGGMLFADVTKTELNLIPQVGAGGDVTIKVAGGHMDIGFADIPAYKSQLVAGTIRLLAVMGSERLKAYPDVPTLKELGYNVDISTPRPVITPKSLPDPIYQTLVKAFTEAALDPKYKEIAKGLDANAVWFNAQETTKIFDEQEKMFPPIFKAAGLLKN